MMLDIYAFVLICGIGFVCAALIRALFNEIKQLSDVRFPSNILTILLIMLPITAFSGPYWVLQEAYKGTMQGRISMQMGLMGLAISLIWSFCAGVFVVEFLHLLQLI